MTSLQRPRVFLDVNIGEQPAGRLIVELFTDKAPRAAENFRQLCTGEHNGLSYAKVPFHRVVDEFMIQGGDIAKGDGTGAATSIYDGAFEDENLEWRDMGAAGLVCCATRGRDSNSSQFFITLAACPHLDHKQTIFGRLVSGEETLQRIAKVATDRDDRPIEPILVSRCGELEKKRKTAAPPVAAAAPREADDRGRRRKSGTSDDEMDASPPPQTRKNRRQSDAVVDEGLRGRPRLRSGSRSPESDGSEEDAGHMTDSHSPVKVHKRKRSQSPSRHLDRRDEKAGYERRRRSLPNQYANDHAYRNDDRYRPSPRRDGYQRSDRYRDDRHRSSYKDRDGRLGDDGRLGSGGFDDFEPPVKFKGRGVMKYREPDKAW